MVITKLKDTTGAQVRKLLEANGVSILKDTGKRFDIICPVCSKKEAFIEYCGEYRHIKCNRDNKCKYQQGLWELIAEKQGLNSQNNQKMLDYINCVIGQDFLILPKKTSLGYDIPKTESTDQKFLIDCNQVFTDCLHEQGDEQVAYSLRYLKDYRGYSDAQIKSFNLGFFPDLDKFISLLVKAGYSKDKAEKLINQYFSGVLNTNNHQKAEENKNRITFTWFDTRENIIGFSTRKPTDNEKIKPKYINNTGLGKADNLFNLTKEAEGKDIVIVEGQFDALAGTYFAIPQEEIRNYHFVAIGGNKISESQVASLKALNCKRVILFLDNDEAGENGKSQSAEKLIAAGINPDITNIPKECECKDIDELIRKYKDDVDGEYPDLKEILDNATKYETAVNSDKPIKETQMEQIKEEKPKLDPELQELLNQIKSDGVEYDSQTEKTKVIPLDILDYAKRINAIRTRIVKENIGSDRKKDPNFIALNSIYSDIREYNKLLTTDENEDKPYTFGQFFEELAKNTNNGLKTGFLELDEHITIQPSSLTFIAGRPSHGKTTFILNMLINMIQANPEKAFLFYSYEETRSDILIKIILSVADDGLNQELINAKVEGTNLRQRALNDLKKHPYCFRENNQEEKTALNSKLENAYKKVEAWIEDGRLEILTPKSTAESLSTAIIERCTAFKEEQAKQDGVKKKVAAVFIDYVQKLNTEEDSVNRQQEIQKICQTLLSTALDKRAGTSIILGAQVNRNVTSFDTLTLDNMREAGDIEQDANLVLGVWNETFIKINNLIKERQELVAEQENKNTQTIKNQINDIDNKLKEAKKQQEIMIRVLKNRNGQNNGIFELDGYLDRYFIGDKVDKNSDRRITMQERSRHVST